MKSIWRRPSKLSGRIAIACVLLLIAYLYSRCMLFPATTDNASACTSIPLQVVTPWSEYAYVTYATDTDYLCNSLMLLERLHRLQAKADKLLLYSDQWHEDDHSAEAKLLRHARDVYKAVLKPVRVQTMATMGYEQTWASSFTKLMAFNQTQYRRVLSLDSDSTLLRPMDELFLLPSTPVAMPRAYWEPNSTQLCNAVALIEPSANEYQRLQRQLIHRGPEDYDMNIMNRLYGSTCLVLPHRPYLLLSGEISRYNHDAYTGGAEMPWSARDVLNEAKYVHFSDWPLAKPWRPMNRRLKEDARPSCKVRDQDRRTLDCEDQQMWDWLYKDFRQRRVDICGQSFDTWTKNEAQQEVEAKIESKLNVLTGD